MNKTVKRKLIGAIICLILSILVWTYLIINYNKISGEFNAYLSGFAGGVFGVGLYTLVTSIIAIRNPAKIKELENKMNDERLISNNNYAMSIAFRISILTEAIISIVCAIIQQMEVAKYMGFAICFQLILYLVIYFVISKKK